MRRGIKAGLVCALAAGCVLAGNARAVAAPPNDEFANRTELSGALPIEVVGSNVGATPDLGESAGYVGPFAVGHSIWFRWTAPESRYFTIGACDSQIRAVLGVFTGTAVGSLARATHPGNGEGPHCPFTGSEYTFKASAGTEYAIGLDGNGFYVPPSPPPLTEGSLSLKIEATPAPVNDQFEAATQLDGSISEEPGGHRLYFASTRVSNWGATKQQGEPDHAGSEDGASVWYRWTAPESGLARVSTCCFGAAVLGVYEGTAVGALSAVASGVQRTEFFAAAGTNYRIGVDGAVDPETGEPGMGSFELGVSMPILAPGPQSMPVGSGDAGTRSTSTMASHSLEVSITRIRVRAAARTATVAFRSSEPGTTFTCKLDRRKRTACASPMTYRRIPPGEHSIEVSGVNVTGSAGAAAAERFRVPSPKHRRN